MSKWYVVATKPAREHVAVQQLRNQQFEVFLPLRLKTVRHARRITTRRAPLFPGYLFIHLDGQAIRWRAINGTIGVKSLISQDDQPIPLPNGFVDSLIARIGEDGTLDLRADLKVGDQVELMAGPFARQVGELSVLDDRGRVAVLLKMLSRVVPVQTTLENLAPV